jgi:ferredoxin
METTIFYFTGSGNSLANARRLAAELGGARLVSMPRALGEGFVPPSGRIGLVFPTYAYGLPRMVREFAEKAVLPEDAYVFAVASSFGIPGPVLRQLSGILRKRGVRLQAGFAVLDERSSLLEDPDNDAIQKLMISVNRGEFPARSGERMAEITRTVAACRPRRLEGSNRLTNIIGGLLNPLAVSTFKKMGRQYRSNGSCSGCGTCVRLCPRNNIRLEDGRPVWGDDCEMCHACIQWCPAEAVQHGQTTEDKPRYRNPEVTVQDMLLR